jgi:hypothetical protein
VIIRKGSACLIASLLFALVLTPARGDVISESKDFRLITSVPLGGIAVSGQAVGDTYFISSWQTGLYSYDISDPTDPKPLDHMGADEIQVQTLENEDMATNGEILLLSQLNWTDHINRLLVIDVRDPGNMEVLATLPDAGAHTMECLLDCKWAYGSTSGTAGAGIIVDLRDPSEPKLLDKRWSEAIGGVAAHDVTEVRPGLTVTSSTPMFLLDTSDPAKPRALMQVDEGGPHTGHNNIWPRAGKDRFVISASEAVNNGRCEMYGENGKVLQIWDTTGWRNDGFKRVGQYTVTNGTGTDGQPPVDALGVQGCSAHWAQANPRFRNGGLVAMAAYSHGVRLLDVGSNGKAREVGWFLKDVHGAIDVEWVTDRILYVIEDGGGLGAFDVIEYTGKL